MDNSAPPAAKRILVVEDEDALANALRMKLSSAGFEVDVAGSGQEGFDKAAGGGYDLILLDLILPVFDGFTVLQKLKDKGNKIPIIILSNLGQPEDVEKAKGLGAIDFLVKSEVQLSKILEFIQKTVAT